MFVVLKIVVTVAAVIALASAWSARFSREFDAFQPPSPQSPFGPFFLQQDSFLQPQPPRYSNAPRPLPLPLPPPPPPPPPSLFFRQPLQFYHQQSPATALAAPRPPVSVAQERPVNQVHHLHHVFYHFYLPVGQTGRTGGGPGPRNDRQPSRKPCDDCYYPVATTECPPSYLPPPPPPTPPPPPPPPPPPSPPPPTQAPCEDDTVVVDNAEYFPFGRSPIVVATEATGVRRAVQERGQDDRPRGKENKSAFILANYLLPPDK